MSVFDYVNGWRVRAAESRILKGRETILAIAPSGLGVLVSIRRADLPKTVSGGERSGSFRVQGVSSRH